MVAESQGSLDEMSPMCPTVSETFSFSTPKNMVEDGEWS